MTGESDCCISICIACHFTIAAAEASSSRLNTKLKDPGSNSQSKYLLRDYLSIGLPPGLSNQMVAVWHIMGGEVHSSQVSLSVIMNMEINTLQILKETIFQRMLLKKAAGFLRDL